VFQTGRSSASGDVLEVSGQVHQPSASAVTGLVAICDPAGTTLVARSELPPARSPAPTARTSPHRVDAGRQAARRHERQVPVPIEEYRALRWNLGTLAPAEPSRCRHGSEHRATAGSRAAGQVPYSRLGS